MQLVSSFDFRFEKPQVSFDSPSPSLRFSALGADTSTSTLLGSVASSLDDLKDNSSSTSHIVGVAFFLAAQKSADPVKIAEPAASAAEGGLGRNQRPRPEAMVFIMVPFGSSSLRAQAKAPPNPPGTRSQM